MTISTTLVKFSIFYTTTTWHFSEYPELKKILTCFLSKTPTIVIVISRVTSIQPCKRKKKIIYMHLYIKIKYKAIYCCCLAIWVPIIRIWWMLMRASDREIMNKCERCVAQLNRLIDITNRSITKILHKYRTVSYHHDVM